METVFKTSYTLVTEENGIITIRQRSRTGFLIALTELVIGILSYAASRMRFTGDGGMERFCFWAAVVILPLAGMMFIIGLLRSLNSKTVFDCNSGKMKKGSKIYQFSQIENLKLERMPFADSEIFFVTAVINGKPLKLASETTKNTLEEVAGFLNQKLAVRETAVTTVKKDNASTASWAGRHFIGILLVVLGLTLAGTGFVLLQDLIFTAPGNAHGPLIWPLGIWITGLGLGDLIGLPVARVFKRGSEQSKVTMIIMILYFGSYFLICWR